MKEKKFASEFDTIKEIIDFLNSDNDIKIDINSEEYWDGLIQLRNDSSSGEAQHKISSSENGDEVMVVKIKNLKREDELSNWDNFNSDEELDLKKPIYQERYYVWAEAVIKKDTLLNKLNSYLKEGNSEDDDFYEFIDYCEFSSGAVEAIKEFDFNAKIIEKGVTLGTGDEISWSKEVYIRDNSVDFLFYK